MLAPEVWSFRTKETSNSVYASEFKSYKLDSIDHLINSSYFNHSIAFTITGGGDIPEDLTKVLEADSEYYLVSNVKVSEFYDSVFVDSFIRKGKLSLISIESDVHSANSFAITPNGLLVLRLLEESFTCLGIEGKRISVWNNDHYVITLDLNKKEITSGKLYERYYKFLTDSDLRFDTIVIWEPHETSICPSSVASYFCKKSYKVSLCSPKHTFVKQFEENLLNPFETEPEDFLHWFGVHLMEADKKPKSIESIEKINMLTHKWTGFFTTTQVLNLWQCLRKMKESISSQCWISLYFSGFQNSPLNFLFHSPIHVSLDDFTTIFCSDDCCVVYPAKPIKKT